MKNKNPSIFPCVIWCVITIVLQVASVVVFTNGNSGVGAILLGCAVGFAFVTQMRAIKFFEGMQNALQEMMKEMEAEEENRPFKEFDRDVPFPEVKEKKE